MRPPSPRSSGTATGDCCSKSRSRPAPRLPEKKLKAAWLCCGAAAPKRSWQRYKNRLRHRPRWPGPAVNCAGAWNASRNCAEDWILRHSKVGRAKSIFGDNDEEGDLFAGANKTPCQQVDYMESVF